MKSRLNDISGHRIASQSLPLLTTLIVITSLLWPFCTLEGGDRDDEVLKRVSPALVRITDSECRSSGLVLSREGVILTSYHAVCSPLSRTVTAVVEEKGKRVTRDFKKIVVTGVHPTRNLALIKVDAKDVAFVPVRVHSAKRSGRAVKTGDACYLILDIGEEKLKTEISSGLVSAAVRKLHDRSFVQISNDLTVESVGGAVCNQRGHLIGVAAFPAAGVEGIGFAIPATQFRPSHFVDPGRRKPNRKLAAKYVAISSKIIAAAARAGDERRQMMYAQAYAVMRMALSEDPSSSELLFNVASTHFLLKNMDLAQTYVDLSYKKRRTTQACWLQGLLFAVKKDHDKAEQKWLEGLVRKSSDTHVAMCAVIMAERAAKNEEHFSACYYARWAVSEDSDLRLPQLYYNSLSKISPAAAKVIAAKRRNFSSIELARLVKQHGRPRVVKRPVADVDGAAVKGRDPGASFIEVKGGEDLSCTLWSWCGSGRYLVFLERVKPKAQLVVLDLRRAEISRRIAVKYAPESKLSAAGNRAAIYYGSENRIDVWNVTTGKQEQNQKKHPYKERYHSFTLAPDGGTEAWVSWTQPRTKTAAPRKCFGYMDILTFKRTECRFNVAADILKTFSLPSCFVVSDDGKQLGVVAGIPQSRLHWFEAVDHMTMKPCGHGLLAGYAFALGGNQAGLLSASKTIVSPQMVYQVRSEKRWQPTGARFFPVHGGQWFVSKLKSNVSVHRPTDFSTERRIDVGNMQVRRVWASSATDRLVIFSGGNSGGRTFLIYRMFLPRK